MFEIKKCKECQKTLPKTNEEFNIRLENAKIKLHIKYICFIATTVLIWLITTGTAKDKEFTSWVSFASTIASIILSVLAIIMSITGENKSEAARNQLEDTSKKIDRAVEEMNSINNDTQENITSVKESINLLDQKIESMDGHLLSYTKENSNKDVRSQNNFQRNVEWSGK